jgi:O-antigen/teichoic acid export membrane protein
MYVMMSGGAAIASLGKTLSYATVLGPEGFGFFSLALLVVALGSYLATFGLQDALAREVPLRRGRGESVAELRGTVFVSVFLGVSVIGIVVGGMGVVFAGHGLPKDAWWMGPFLIASVIFNVAQVDLQVREQSGMQAGLLLSKSAVPLAVILSTEHSWSASDVLVLETVVQYTLCVMAILHKSGEILWRLDVPETKRLARMGLPFMGSSLAHNLAMNLDRWALQWVFGMGALGTYAFAMQLVAAGLVMLNTIQMYVTPRWLRAWASEGDQAALWRRARFTLVLTSSVCVTCSIIGLFLVPIIVQYWWPAYEAALPLLPFVAVGAAAVSLGYFNVFFLAANAGGKLVWVHVVTILFNIPMIIIFVWLGAPLVAYAIGFSAARVLTLLLGWFSGRAALMAVKHAS